MPCSLVSGALQLGCLNSLDCAGLLANHNCSCTCEAQHELHLCRGACWKSHTGTLRQQLPLALCLPIGVNRACLLASHAGYQAGVLNTALPYVTADLQYPNEAVLSSAVVAGAAFGAIVAGKIADAVGPRRAQLINSIPFVLGALFSALSPGRQVGFLAGRLLSGFGEHRLEPVCAAETGVCSCNPQYWVCPA